MQTEYHKIQTVFKRDPDTQFKTLLEGQWALPEFEYLADNKWVFTEKIHGSSVRTIYDGSSIDFKGRTDAAQLPKPLVERLNERFFPLQEEFQELFGEHQVVLYGEGYGGKIQKGRKYRADEDFVLFDVRVGHTWLERHNVEDIANKFDLDVVPIIGTGNLYEMIGIVSEGFDSQWGDFEAEGIVARPLVELKTRHNHRVITKLKCKDFRP